MQGYIDVGSTVCAVLSSGTISCASWCLYMNYASRYALTSINDIKIIVNDVINGVEKHITLTEERRYDITLVINELLANSFEHAGSSEKDPVWLETDLKDGCLTINITDRGYGFAYDNVCTHIPKQEEMLLKERGRGLKLVRALCQQIRYNRVGNSVTVTIAL